MSSWFFAGGKPSPQRSLRKSAEDEEKNVRGSGLAQAADGFGYIVFLK
jgi:hypothetical protein